MASLLFSNGRIYAPSEPFADSMLVEDGLVRWIGQSEAANLSGIQAIDLEGALVTPGFVDAHIHMTSAGLQLISLDLSGCRSKEEMLGLLESATRERRGAPIIGHGWDETKWMTQEVPTINEIDRATFGSVVYLSRIDVHSALISSSSALLVKNAHILPGWSESGWVRAQAHGSVRSTLLQEVGGALGSKAREAFIDHCFSHGITSVHECGGPEIAGETDFLAVISAAERRGLDLIALWGEFAAFEKAHELGAHGVGGDLFLDGSIGSHTAALSHPYADANTNGTLYLEEEEVFEHLRLGTSHGVQVGFHAIGDRALETFTHALKRLDPTRTRPLRHRVEHAEMVGAIDLDVWRRHGVIPSVQPLFDEYWGGGMYPQRLGAERAATLNPFAQFLKSGLTMAFSSDAPVTRSDPWQWIRAAVFHTNPEQRITARAAFNAATRGARRAAHQDDQGVLTVGSKADFVVWKVDQTSVQTPDPRIAAWSTDERAGTPELPTLAHDIPLPECQATYVGGSLVYQRD